MNQHSRRLLNVLIDNNAYTEVLYPLQTGVPAVGQPLACGNGVWGNYATIIGAAVITIPFWLLQAQMDTIDGTLYDVQIYDLTRTTTVYEMRFNFTAATVNISPVTFRIPIYCNANDQIQGRAGGTNTKVIGVSLLTATGI